MEQNFRCILFSCYLVAFFQVKLIKSYLSCHCQQSHNFFSLLMDKMQKFNNLYFRQLIYFYKQNSDWYHSQVMNINIYHFSFRIPHQKIEIYNKQHDLNQWIQLFKTCSNSLKQYIFFLKLINIPNNLGYDKVLCSHSLV